MSHIIETIGHMAIFAVLMAVSRQVLNRWDSSVNDDDSAILNGNMAVAIRHGSFYVALGIALFATFSLPGNQVTVVSGLMESLVWGLAVVVALFVSFWLNDRLILRSVNNCRAVGQDNYSVAIVEGASLIGTSIVLTGTMHGTGPILPTVAFFVAGQLVMVATALLYERVAKRQNLETEVGINNNLAAGILLAGKILAIAIIIRNAISGDSNGLLDDAVKAAVSCVFGFGLLILSEFAVDGLLLPKVTVTELVQQRKAAPMVLVSAISIATACLVVAVTPF